MFVNEAVIGKVSLQKIQGKGKGGTVGSTSSWLLQGPRFKKYSLIKTTKACWQSLYKFILWREMIWFA
jgi:hypothetical protein